MLCKPKNSESWRTNNPGTFRILIYLKPETYSEPSQMFKMVFICKNSLKFCFYKMLFLRSLKGF